MLNETESKTRYLVINSVWFALVMFIIFISFFYSCSLYNELGSLEYNHHRLSVFTTKDFTMSTMPNSKFLINHMLIVKETSRRLIIFIFLIVIFCLTFLPNFVMTMLKNVLDTSLYPLKPYILVGSIINLANPSLNSIVLLCLCIISNDSNMSQDMTDENCDDETNAAFDCNFFIRVLFRRSLKACHHRFKTINSADNLSHSVNKNNNNNNNNSHHKISLITDECVCLKSIDSSNKFSTNAPREMTSGFSSPHSVKEFYSKVGNRLGNPN